MDESPAYIMSPNYDGIENYDNGKKIILFLNIVNLRYTELHLSSSNQCLCNFVAVFLTFSLQL